MRKKGKGWVGEWYPSYSPPMWLFDFEQIWCQYTQSSVFQPAWGASSATGDARDAVSVLLLLIIKRLSPASDTGCVTQEGFVCHWDTDWNNATRSDNVKTKLNNQLSWYLCSIAGWSILIKVARCIPLSSQANVQYICTDFVWTKEPHRFINRNLSLYAQYRFVFVSISLFQCVIVALSAWLYFILLCHWIGTSYSCHRQPFFLYRYTH